MTKSWTKAFKGYTDEKLTEVLRCPDCLCCPEARQQAIAESVARILERLPKKEA